jgi:hypothetical protein
MVDRSAFAPKRASAVAGKLCRDKPARQVGERVQTHSPEAPSFAEASAVAKAMADSSAVAESYGRARWRAGCGRGWVRYVAGARVRCRRVRINTVKHAKKAWGEGDIGSPKPEAQSPNSERNRKTENQAARGDVKLCKAVSSRKFRSSQ